jgi:hypothetical protein
VLYLTNDNWQRVAEELGPDIDEPTIDCASWLHYLVRDSRNEGNEGFAIWGDSSLADTFFAACKRICVKLGFCKP